MASTVLMLNAATAVATGQPVSADVYVEQEKIQSFQAYGSTTAGAGAVVVEIYVSNDGEVWIDDPVLTISLTLGTTVTSDGAVIQTSWNYYRADVASISGTGASVTVKMGV